MRPIQSSEVDAIRLRSRARLNLSPIIIGQSVSLLGDYIAFVTLPLFVIELTGRAIDLGLTSAAETLPLLFFGFAAGVIIDRYRVKRIIISADIVRAFAFAVLAVGAAGDALEIWMVFAAAFLIGTMTTFFDSGLQSMLPGVLGQAMLVDANSRLSLARTLAFSVGPVIGGLLVASRGGFPVAFGVNGATFIVSAFFLLRVQHLGTRADRDPASFGVALRKGLAFLARSPHLRWGTIGAAIVNFVFAPLQALLILFVADQLAGKLELPGWVSWLFFDEAEVGLFIALQAGIGSIGVALAPRIARRLELGRMYVIGMILMGGGFIAVSQMTTFIAVLPAAVALTGVGWINVALATLRQRLSPPEMLGRVTSASRTIAYLFIPLGAGIGGFVADEIGLVTVYLAGSVTVFILAFVFLLTPLWWQPGPRVDETAASPLGRTVRQASKARG